MIDTDTYADPGREFDATWAGLAVDRLFEELDQPPAGGLRLFAGGEKPINSATGWRTRSLRRSTREEVHLLPGEHGLRAENRLAGDEFRRPSRAPRNLSGSAQR